MTTEKTLPSHGAHDRRLSPQDALISVMIVASAASGEMSAPEQREIESIVGLLPVFRGYDVERIAAVSEATLLLLEREDGLDDIISRIRESVPPRLHETAYALACDVVAADERAGQPELRFLEMLRQDLHIDRLNAAAIERGSRARHMRA